VLKRRLDDIEHLSRPAGECNDPDGSPVQIPSAWISAHGRRKPCWSSKNSGWAVDLTTPRPNVPADLFLGLRRPTGACASLLNLPRKRPLKSPLKGQVTAEIPARPASGQCQSAYTGPGEFPRARTEADFLGRVRLPPDSATHDRFGGVCRVPANHRAHGGRQLRWSEPGGGSLLSRHRPTWKAKHRPAQSPPDGRATPKNRSFQHGRLA